MIRRFQYRVYQLLAAVTLVAVLLGAGSWYFLGTRHHMTLKAGDYLLDISRSVRVDSSQNQFFFRVIAPGQAKSSRRFLVQTYNLPRNEATFHLARDGADPSHFLIYQSLPNLVMDGSRLRGIDWPKFLFSRLGIVGLRIATTSTGAVEVHEEPASITTSRMTAVDKSDADEVIRSVEQLEVNGFVSRDDAETLAGLPRLRRLSVDGLGVPISEETVWVLLAIPSLSDLTIDQVTAKALSSGLIEEVRQSHPTLGFYYYDVGKDSIREVAPFTNDSD